MKSEYKFITRGVSSVEKLALLTLTTIKWSVWIYLLYLFLFFTLKPIDSTDVTMWNRSGMTVRLDNETGLEYLESSSGFLVPRYDLQSNNKIIIRRAQ